MKKSVLVHDSPPHPEEHISQRQREKDKQSLRKGMEDLKRKGIKKVVKSDTMSVERKNIGGERIKTA